jgi:hypothetical protein
MKAPYAYQSKPLIDNLIAAFYITNDLKSFMKIVEQYYVILKNEFERFGNNFPNEINDEMFLDSLINAILDKISKSRGQILLKEVSTVKFGLKRL